MPENVGRNVRWIPRLQRTTDGMRLISDELLTAVSLSDPARDFHHFDPMALAVCGSLSSTQLPVSPGQYLILTRH